MSEPLTDEELQMLTSLARQLSDVNPVEHAGEADKDLVDRAAAEIRGLRKSVKNLVEAAPAAFNIIEAENARLRTALEKYGRHKYGCDRWGWNTDGKCTCGLDAAFAGKESDDE